MSEFLAEVKAVESAPGRPAVDPRINLGLWVLGTLEGIGSARTLQRYCYEHHAFIWMRGDVSTNYHSLSDFRNQGKKLENLLTQVVASLIDQGIVSTESWAQDGMRVRANAGSGSFRREDSLKNAVRKAKERLEQLKKNAQSEGQKLSIREKAAKERAASERLERSKKALETIKELKQDIDGRKRSKKEKRKLKEKARASTTDPEARKMKMPNGGYNPAYNVQYVTDTKSRIIVGVRTVDEGSDAAQLEPMLEHVRGKYENLPEKWLVDAGYVSEIGLLKAQSLGMETMMPVPERTRKKYKVGAPIPGNSNVMALWVERMESQQGQELYKDRASTAEFSNASTRNKGFYQFKVRGLFKAQATSVLFALVHNFERLASLMNSGIDISLNFV